MPGVTSQCLAASRQSSTQVLPFRVHQKHLGGISRETTNLWESYCHSLLHTFRTQGWHLLARCSLTSRMLLIWFGAGRKPQHCTSIPRIARDWWFYAPSRDPEATAAEIGWAKNLEQFKFQAINSTRWGEPPSEYLFSLPTHFSLPGHWNMGSEDVFHWAELETSLLAKKTATNSSFIPTDIESFAWHANCMLEIWEMHSFSY